MAQDKRRRFKRNITTAVKKIEGKTMSNYVDTIRKATRLGANDATQGFKKNSRSKPGSMWDHYYNKGYDKVIKDKR